MISKHLVKSITDVRTDPISLFRLAKKKESPLFVFNRAEPLGVILSWEDYEALLEKLEDAIDLAELKKARSTSDELISWDKAKKKINLDV